MAPATAGSFNSCAFSAAHIAQGDTQVYRAIVQTKTWAARGSGASWRASGGSGRLLVRLGLRCSSGARLGI